MREFGLRRTLHDSVPRIRKPLLSVAGSRRAYIVVCSFCAVIVSASVWADEPFDYRDELDRALARFTAEKQELKTNLLDDFRRAEAIAVRNGYEGTLNRVVADRNAFENKGIAPGGVRQDILQQVAGEPATIGITLLVGHQDADTTEAN